jgi:hypothetical protein
MANNPTSRGGEYGRWDGDLQMFCVAPIQFRTAQPTDPEGTPLLQQGEATDDEWNHLVRGLNFLKWRADRGDVGPLSMEDAAPTIKEVTSQSPTEAPKTPPFKGPGWSLGPAHPDYKGSMHEEYTSSDEP